MVASKKSHEFLEPPTQSGDLGTLGHYRVIDELGRGGMGFVFRAEDIKLKRSVALKVMNQKIAATPNSRRRFIHEARAMAAVHHDNVATIFEVGESKGTPFMAMEMLKGTTVETFNKEKNRLPFEQIIEYARQIAHGLAAAHANGIVHRDIKPANIWIEEGKNRIKILDFGLALASTPVDHLAGRGAVIGTPGYLSPEQARSEPLDDRSDLYSMGVVLYELCTGKLPIQAKSVPGQLISILAHRPTPINELNPDIPQPLCDLVHRLLRKEPRSRPSSAEALLEDLDRVESECHAKSEVAQAINKLQLGLNEVVSKSGDTAMFDEVEELTEAIPDPLATIPAPVTMAPVAKPVTRKKAAPPDPPAWQAYWPFAAIGAVVLIALPVLTFAFSGAGKQENYVISSNDNGPAPASNPQSQSQQSSQNASGGSQARPTRQNKNAGSNTQGNGQRKGGQNKRRENNQNRPNDAQRENQSAIENPSRGAAGTSEPEQVEPAGKNDSSVTKNLASVGSKSTGDPEPNPTSPEPDPSASSAPKPAADPPPPEIEMKWTSISTGDGKGADVMVQKAGNQNYASKPSFGIGTRGRIETHHSYLQFDLESLGDLRKHVENAELILTLLGGRDQPESFEIRVYGIADVGVWKEEILKWRNSYSAEGLDSLPLIADIKADLESLEQSDYKKFIRISTPELARFVANHEGETVTFVIAGSAPNSSVIRFLSCDSDVKKPPLLRLETPRNPPPDEKKRNNRGR